MTQENFQETLDDTKIDLSVAIPTSVKLLLRNFQKLGLSSYLVGGCVRDALLGLEPKDIDVEVYGVSYDELEFFLSKFGTTDLVGKSFGVIKFTDQDGNTCDFSIPRRDSKAGEGHRGFEIEVDGTISEQEAASRRDFTINALMYDPLSKTLLDFFGGRTDLEARNLKATSGAFADDPLRILRGMQFAARFDMIADAVTAMAGYKCFSGYESLAKERVCEEWMKLMTKGVKPSKALDFLHDTGWIQHFPELEGIEDVKQDMEWHPEGGVFEHTGHVLDAMVEIVDRKGIVGDERAVLMFSALGHDFGKAVKTEFREKNGKMRWTAHGHEAASGPLMRSFLERVGVKADIIAQCVPLVENHMAHVNFENETVAPRVVRRLAERLAPANIQQLAMLVEADVSGRPPLEKHVPFSVMRMIQLSYMQNVALKPQPPLVQGRHVMPLFGNVAGRHIGVVTKAAYDAQLEGEFSKEPEALEWIERYVAEMEIEV